MNHSNPSPSKSKNRSEWTRKDKIRANMSVGYSQCFDDDPIVYDLAEHKLAELEAYEDQYKGKELFKKVTSFVEKHGLPSLDTDPSDGEPRSLLAFCGLV